jgi:hypothetical protein
MKRKRPPRATNLNFLKTGAALCELQRRALRSLELPDWALSELQKTIDE